MHTSFISNSLASPSLIWRHSVYHSPRNSLGATAAERDPAVPPSFHLHKDSARLTSPSEVQIRFAGATTAITTVMASVLPHCGTAKTVNCSSATVERKMTVFTCTTQESQTLVTNLQAYTFTLPTHAHALHWHTECTRTHGYMYMYIFMSLRMTVTVHYCPVFTRLM